MNQDGTVGWSFNDSLKLRLKLLPLYLCYLPDRFLHLIIYIFDLLLQLLNVVQDLDSLFFYLCDFLFYLGTFQSLK